MTLEEQHKKFLLENPDIKLTFMEWIRLFSNRFRTLPENFEPTVSDNFMIGPQGALNMMKMI
jgi:hypothetical protein